MATFVNGAVSASSTSQSTTKTVTYSPTTGNTLLVFAAGVGTNISSVTDNATGGSNVYTKLAGPSTNTVEGSMWGTAPGGVKAGVTTITVTFASSTRSNAGVVEYSGAKSFGNVNNSSTGSSTNPNAAVTTQDNNNIIVGGFSREGTSTWSAHSGQGTLRKNQAGGGSTTPGIGIVDNTSATPASVTVGATVSSTGVWCGCAVELRSVAAIADSATDSASFSESLGENVTLHSSFSDSNSFSEALTEKVVLGKVIVDSVVFSDVSVEKVSLLSSLLDSVSFSDSVSGTTTSSGNHPSVMASDSLSFSESLNRSVQLKPTIADTLSVSEGLISRIAINRASADSFSVFENSAPKISVLKVSSDSLSFSESNISQRGVSAAASDSVVFSESNTRLVNLILDVYDGFTSNEILQGLSSNQPSHQSFSYSWTLSNMPIEHIILALLLNPDAPSFPWGNCGYGAEVPRAVLQHEVDTRPLSETTDGRLKKGYPVGK